MPHLGHIQIDTTLDDRVRNDIGRYRFRRGVFAALSVCVIFAELTFGVATVLATLAAHNEETTSTHVFVYSAVSAFVITVDVAFGIRERASAHHATLNQLIGIRDQMRNPGSSPLWQEYGTIRAYSKINYIEAVFDSCTWTVPPPLAIPPTLPPAPRSLARGRGAEAQAA